MADDEQAVTLGTGTQVEGAPLARVSARLTWGVEKSAVERREGDTVIRTPDGPRELGDVLGAVDQPYFATQQEFEDAVRSVIGTGPIPTAGEDDEETASDDAADETDADDESVDDEQVDDEPADEGDESAEESEPADDKS